MHSCGTCVVRAAAAGSDLRSLEEAMGAEEGTVMEQLPRHQEDKAGTVQDLGWCYGYATTSPDAAAPQCGAVNRSLYP
jgi:hypothetical protein